MKNIYLLLALITLGLCACTFPGVSESAPSEEQVQTAIAATRSASPSETPQPTFTETTAPTETDVPPEAPTEASLPTETAATESDSAPEDPESQLVDNPLSDAFIYSNAFLANQQFLVTIQLPEDVSGTYRLEADDKAFTCQVLDQYPDRLYCSGPSLESGKQVLVKVFEADSDEVLFEDEMLVPALPFAAPQPSRPGGGGGQPSRGGEPSRPYPYP